MAFFVTMFIFWLFLILVAVVVEFHTAQQIGLSIAVSSIVAIIVHSVYWNLIWPEFVAFSFSWVLSAGILFFFFRRFRKSVHDSSDGYLDIINKEFVAIQGNESGFGNIGINDKIFRFKSKDQISKGDKVLVNSIKGVTLQVSRVSKNKSKK